MVTPHSTRRQALWRRWKAEEVVNQEKAVGRMGGLQNRHPSGRGRGKRCGGKGKVEQGEVHHESASARAMADKEHEGHEAWRRQTGR